MPAAALVTFFITTTTAAMKIGGKSHCVDPYNASIQTCFWLEFEAHVGKWHAPGCSGKHISVKRRFIFALQKSNVPTLHGDQNQGFATRT